MAELARRRGVSFGMVFKRASQDGTLAIRDRMRDYALEEAGRIAAEKIGKGYGDRIADLANHLAEVRKRLLDSIVSAVDGNDQDRVEHSIIEREGVVLTPGPDGSMNPTTVRSKVVSSNPQHNMKLIQVVIAAELKVLQVIDAVRSMTSAAVSRGKIRAGVVGELEGVVEGGGLWDAEQARRDALEAFGFVDGPHGTSLVLPGELVDASTGKKVDEDDEA